MRFAIFLAGLMLTVAQAGYAADLAAGKKVFTKCRACHAVGENAKNKVGPHLNGILGRPWGAVEGFKYSSGKDGTLISLKEAEPRVWDVETLSAYLRKPKGVIPRSKMEFPGLRDDADVTNVIYYLAQFDAEGNEVDPDAVLDALAATD